VRQLSGTRAMHNRPARSQHRRRSHWHQVNAHREHMAKEESMTVFKQRGSIVERVFAHIKGHWGFNRWGAKGLANVQAQWGMLCSTWNLTRIFTRWQQTPGLFATVRMAG
jgi:hypothetical protein